MPLAHADERCFVADTLFQAPSPEMIANTVFYIGSSGIEHWLHWMRVCMQAPMIMKRLEQTLGRSYVRIGAAVSLMVFILHVFACVFHYVAIVASSGRTWIQASGIVNSKSIWDRWDAAFLLRRSFLLCCW